MSKDAKYKVGDTVRIIRAKSGYYNCTGEIKWGFVNGYGDRMYDVRVMVDLSETPVETPFYEDDLELVESITDRAVRCGVPPVENESPALENESSVDEAVLQQLQTFINTKNSESQSLTRFYYMYLMLLKRYQSRLQSSESDQKAIMDLKIQNNNYAIVFETLGLNDVDDLAKKILDLKSLMKS